MYFYPIQMSYNMKLFPLEVHVYLVKFEVIAKNPYISVFLLSVKTCCLYK
jgi:hypothetical protein